MTLPLFPDPPAPEVARRPSVRQVKASPPEAPPPESISSSLTPVPTAPLSVREVAGLIQERLRPLAATGRRIVHAQWIKPGMNAGARGFLSVTLADTQDTNVSIDGFIWDRADV